MRNLAICGSSGDVRMSSGMMRRLAQPAIQLLAFLLTIILLAAFSAPAFAADGASSTSPPATQPHPAARDLEAAMKGDAKISVHDLTHFSFWEQSVRDLVVATIAFIPKLIVAIVLFIIFYMIYRAVRRICLGAMKRANVDPSIHDLLAALLKYGILGFGIVIAGNQLGLQITALLTGVSIIGLAVGFAAQATLSNFIAGVVIFWDKPFRVGDWIEISGQYGQVTRISFRSTRILNLDGKVIVIANTDMLSGQVGNHSVYAANRVNVAISIAYKDSIDKARDVLIALCRGDSRVNADPAPSVVVAGCTGSTNLVLRFWTSDKAHELELFYEFLEKSKKALDSAGIEVK
jgi:small conductance mechanosensitive channel